MQELDIVKHRQTGVVGVIVETIHLLRRDGPWSVINDGSSVAIVVEDETEYELVGRYTAVPDEKGCGMGKDEQCCRFLGFTRDGITCLRFGPTHWATVFRFTSGSRRDPQRNYPDCKLPQQATE